MNGYKRALVVLMTGTLMGAASLAQGQTIQRVTTRPTQPSAMPGAEVAVAVLYSAEPATVNGLVLRMHFDSSQLSFRRMDYLYDWGLVGMQVREDTADRDGDAETDRYVLLGWQDIAGGWPGVSTFPAQLCRAVFQATADFDGARLNFSTDTSGAQQFESPAVRIEYR